MNKEKDYRKVKNNVVAKKSGNVTIYERYVDEERAYRKVRLNKERDKVDWSKRSVRDINGR